MKKHMLLVAAALLVLVTAVLVSEFQAPPRHTPEPTEPLTDVAGTAPAPTVRPEEAPQQRLATTPPAPAGQAPEAMTQPPASGPEAPPAKVVPPSLMPDPAHPPQWTRPLALPSTPKPPNPFEPPPIVVDPERGRSSHAE